MTRRIIGVGSPFGADQLGWRAIDLISVLSLPDCDLIKLDRPGSELIRYLEDVQDMVLIDAVQAGGEPGTAIKVEMADLTRVMCQTSSHGIGVAEALLMAEQLGLLPDALLLIGIEAGSDLARIPEIRLDQLSSLLEYDSH